MITQWTKIGIGLSLFGVLFLFLGVLLFFDKGLIAMGDVLFIAGVSLVIGIKKTIGFFMNKRKWLGSLCFFLGFFAVIYGWPVIGMAVQTFGFINLFGSFLPSILYVFSSFPIFSTMSNIPFVRNYIKSQTLPD